MKTKRAILSLLALTFLCSCQEKETPVPDNPTPPQPSGPAIVLDSGQKKDVVVDREGGTLAVSFTASSSWTASLVNVRADSWISVSPSSGGAGKVSVQVTVSGNEGYDERNATLRLTSDGQSESVVFTQKQKDAITLVSDKVEVDSSGGVVTVELKANVEFEYEIDEAGASWITPVTTRSYDSHTVQFSVSENLDMTPREGGVTFTSGQLSETVKIYQDASDPRIVITSHEVTVGSEGGGFTVEVGSNVAVEMTLPEDVSWLREESTRSYSTNTYRLYADPNPDPEDRSAEILFTNTEDGLSEVVTVIQSQRDSMSVSSGDLSIGAEGGVIEVELMSNIDFDIQIDEECSSWIKTVGTRSFDAHTIQFVISENEEIIPRVGTVYLIGENMYETVTIAQEGASPAIKIPEKYFEVASAGGEVTVEVTSNVDVTILVPEDATWVRETTTRSFTTAEHIFTVDPNMTPDDRTVEILFTNEEHELSETVVIVQKQDDQINMATDEVRLSYPGGTFEISLETNVQYEVSIDADWIRESKTRGLVSHTHTFVADVLPEDEYLRSATVTFTDPTGAVSRVVRVIQEDDSETISFVDQETKSLCLSRFDRNRDGELSEREASMVTSLNDMMRYNGNITSFDELVYFTGLTEIDDNAFYYCVNLKSVTLPPGIIKIGSWAFYCCSSLESITIPEGVTAIEEGTFYSCTSLKNIDFKGALTSIARHAFSWCGSLETLTIPADGLSIGEGAFNECEALVSVSVEGEVISIGNYAFSWSPSLRRFECMSVNPPSCGEWPFGGTSLDKGWIIVPEGSVDTYKSDDFWSQFSDGITASGEDNSPIISFKDSEVKGICVERFDRNGDGELSELEASVVSSFQNVVRYNESITSFDEFAYFTGLAEIGNSAFYGCSNLKSVTLPPSISAIGEWAFHRCSSLENLIIPEGVTVIGNGSFYQCSSLKSIDCEGVLTSIGENAFSWCKSLERIAISGQRLSIFNRAFYGCEALASFAVKGDVASIGDYAFYQSHSLRRFECMSVNPPSCGAWPFSSTSLAKGWIIVPEGSVEAYKSDDFWSQFSDGITASVEDNSPIISFKDSEVKGICVERFDRDGDGELSELEASVVSSFDYLMNSKDNITYFDEFVYFTGISEIKDSEFAICSNLKSLTLPPGITSIGRYSFYSCASLEKVIIPDSVTSLGEYAFYNCEDLKSVTLSSGLTSISPHSFDSCLSLEGVVVPGSVTSIGKYAFDRCEALESLILNEGLVSIGEWAFIGCGSLKSLTIPASVNSIEYGAFYDSSWEYIEVLADVPPVIGTYIFGYKCDCYIYVPDGTASEYQETDGWKEYRINITEKGHKPVEFFYSSSDYSRDGEVVCLQQATKGKGITLVFLGDGFVDRDMEPGGKYETVMRRWMDQLFVYEPFKSFREWFTIYTVKVVSRHQVYGVPETERRLTKDVDDDSGSFGNSIVELYDPVREYLANLLSGDELRYRKAAVFMNTDKSVGRSFCSYSSGSANGGCLTWIFDSIDRRPSTLNHELGHGLGWLADEYVEYDQECPNPQNFVAVNRDWRSDPSEVGWSRFLQDSRYANEGLGVFEGAWYAYGLYRPTENSMMRHDFTKGAVYNAPSREQIYKNIMTWGHGGNWSYDYETFVEADAAGRQQAADAYAGKDILGAYVRTRQDSDMEKDFKPGLPPIPDDDRIKEVTVSRDGKVTVKYK